MSDFAERMLEQTTGCTVRITQLSNRRQMTPSQVSNVAALFKADERSVSGSRMVINPKHEAVAEVCRKLRRMKEFVVDRTMTYKPQLNLVRVDQVAVINDWLPDATDELNGLIGDLNSAWGDVKEEAKGRLKGLYQEADYPESPSGHYGFRVEFPGVEPDPKLMQLHPDLFAAERARVLQDLQAAADRAERAARDQLAELLRHFVERLGVDDEGNPQMLRTSTVSNIREFVASFSSVTLGSNTELDALVAEVEGLANRYDPKEIRKDSLKRGEVREASELLLEKIDTLIVAQPSRVLDLD